MTLNTKSWIITLAIFTIVAATPFVPYITLPLTLLILIKFLVTMVLKERYND